jgi:hypothetical protein
MTSSWDAFAAQEEQANAFACPTCLSLRTVSKTADNMVYQLEKQTKRSYRTLNNDDVPTDTKLRLAQLRQEKKNKRRECDDHIAHCMHTTNTDFEWLKRFADTPVCQRRPKLRGGGDVGAGVGRVNNGDCGMIDRRACGVIEEKLEAMREEHEGISSDEDDHSLFGHKSRGKHMVDNSTSANTNLEISAKKHVAILVEEVVDGKKMTSWQIVKVVSTHEGTFTASLLAPMGGKEHTRFYLQRGAEVPRTKPKKYANVNSIFDNNTALCNIGVGRNGMLCRDAKQTPNAQLHKVAIQNLDDMAKQHAASGIADLVRGARPLFVVVEILGHRRPIGSNCVEYRVKWANGEQTWEPEHMLAAAQPLIDSFIQHVPVLPMNGVFVGDWLSFKFAGVKPKGFLHYPQFCGRSIVPMVMGFDQVSALGPESQAWVDVELLCFGLHHVLRQSDMTHRCAMFDPTSWGNFSKCNDAGKHHFLSNSPRLADKEWWLLPMCWSGDCILTRGGALGFGAHGSHWTVVVVHKPENMVASIAHYDPLGEGRNAKTMCAHVHELQLFLKGCNNQNSEVVPLLSAPIQPGGWECGFFVLLFLGRLLRAAANGAALGRIVFSFPTHAVAQLKETLLSQTLEQSSAELAALCDTTENTGTPCAFVVVAIQRIRSQIWCNLSANRDSFWCNLDTSTNYFTQLPSPTGI